MNNVLTLDGDKGNLSIANLQPSYTMTFHDDKGEIGGFDWGDGELKFTGKAEESAKVFFDFLKPYVDIYIREQLER